MSTIYYETLRTGLVPVRNAARVGDVVRAIVSRNRGAYKAGETIEGSPHHFVNKTRIKNGFQMVTQARVDTLDS